MPPDFQRDVHCVLGLPFDALTEVQTDLALRVAISSRKRCFLSTPNLNFVIGCLADEEFRGSVLQSDLSVADGWPIVVVARLLGIPLPERVAGSSLFERIRRSREPTVSVYFFGGPEGAAKVACEQLNATASGAVCKGFDAPGFGTVAQMSSDDHLGRLNSAAADFVVVALGAKKGQAWIQRNLARIDAPVVSHLGAVVNFTARTVSRAPIWFQQSGLEWLWRIKEEPSLWRRYARDAIALTRLIVTRVLPSAIYERIRRPRQQTLQFARASAESERGSTILRLEGAWNHANAEPLKALLQTAVLTPRPVVLDLAEVTYLDSAVIGLLALLYGWQQEACLGWSMRAASQQAKRMIQWACAEYLLEQRGTCAPDV